MLLPVLCKIVEFAKEPWNVTDRILVCGDEIIRPVNIISHCNFNTGDSFTLIYVGAIKILFTIEDSWFIRSGIGISKQQLEVIAPEINQRQRIMRF